MATSKIRVIGFPGTGLLPLFVGIDKGHFEARNINVELERTPSSMYQAQKLVAGEFDIACSAVDNFIAYQEGAGEIELDRDPDLFVFMGSTQIELSFVVSEGIKSFEDLCWNNANKYKGANRIESILVKKAKEKQMNE